MNIEEAKKDLFTFRKWLPGADSRDLLEEAAILRELTGNIKTYKADDEMYFWEILLELRKRKIFIDNPIDNLFKQEVKE